MEQKELNEILESHERWLQEEGGECAKLTGAYLREADLIGADLAGADLAGADLTKANLYGANLTEADLTRANLTEADLTATDLRWANLTGANLTEADLRGANLRWAKFTNVIGLSVLSVQVNTACENRTITYIPRFDIVTAGCFQGTFEEFEKRVEEKHKNNPFVLFRYRRVIAFLKREAEEDETREKWITVGQGIAMSKTIGTLFREKRKEKGMSQVDVAEKAYVSNVAYSQIELGRHDPSWGTLCAIVRALDITGDELVEVVKGEGKSEKA